MVRRFLVAALNVAGIALIVVALALAWEAYNPTTPPLPPDAIVIDEHTPPVELPPAASSAQLPMPDGAPTAPAVLPETKLQTPTPRTQPPPDERLENRSAIRAERKYRSELAAYRAQPFPPPAQSLPTRIILPAIDVDSDVIEVGWKAVEQDGQLVSEWEVADYAVGFHKTSALPGAPGNSVMAGHNNINGEVFRNLVDMKVGDEIFVFADNRPYRYLVAQKLLVKERGVPIEQRMQNAAWIAPTEDVRLTLVSCWPYTSNLYRVILVAKPAPDK